MVESTAAISLAAILVIGGFSLFSRADCHCPTLSSVIFLTAVFSWLSIQNIHRALPCPLPALLLLLYEFLIPLFVFDLALNSFWDPLECYITNALPRVCDKLLDCGVLSLLCSVYLFVALVYVLAGGILWSVLYGHGVIGQE